jgi:hypothetical protein
MVGEKKISEPESPKERERAIERYATHPCTTECDPRNRYYSKAHNYRHTVDQRAYMTFIRGRMVA